MSYNVGVRLGVMASMLILAACQSTQGPSVEGSWKNIGQSANQNVRHELDTASIKRVGDVVTYRDRKVLKDPSLEATPNTPLFKTAISSYQMQCNAKTYRLTATELRDAKGTVIYQQSYGNQIPVQRITAGSPAQKQYEVVCR